MRNFKVIFCFSLLILSSSLCEGQSWVWAKAGVNDSVRTSCDPYSIAVDNKGNVYQTGQFWGGGMTFGFDTLFYHSADADVFLVKYDSGGNALWASDGKLTSGINIANSNSVATDNKGNAYITGFYSHGITFGSFTLSSNNDDAFLVKYSPGGTVQWAKSSKVAANNGAEGYSVTVDNTGNIYVTGYFNGTVSFGSYILSSAAHDVFLVKYDSSGNVLWAKEAVAASWYSSGTGYSVTTDNNCNVYITGDFADTISFGSIILSTYNTPGSIFLVKYDSSGNVLWTKGSGVANLGFSPMNNASYSVVSDKANNVYITGQFVDTITFGSDTLTNNNGHWDIFLFKFDPGGNVIWAQSGKMPQTGSIAIGYSLSADKWNHIYLSGSLNDSIIFGSVKLFSSYFPSIIVEFDTSGKALCGTIVDYRNGDANAVAANPLGQNVYFGDDNEDSTLILGKDTVKGLPDFSFVAKWQPCSVSISLSISGSGDSTCPNSCKGIVKVTPNGGNPPYTYLWSNGETTQTDTGLCVGIYTVTVTDFAGNKVTITDTVFAKPVPVVTLSYQSSDTIVNGAGAIKLFGSPSGGTFSGIGVYGNFFYPDSVPYNATYRFTYSYTDSNGCIATATDSLYYFFIGGIRGLTRDNGQWRIEPNPTAGKAELRITNYELGMKYGLDIFNVFGQLVFSKLSIVNYPFSIDLSSNPNGVYFYRVVKKDGGILGSGKVVIEK